MKNSNIIFPGRAQGTSAKRSVRLLKTPTKLSVALIVKNESALLEQCLNSVKGADEIVIIDTGSTDNTIEIAKKFTDKIFTDYKWEDHFAKARNHAISKCTGDWIFSIDADDVLSEGGIEQIRKTIAEYPDGLCFNIQFITKQGSPSHKLPYLYQNSSKLFWQGAAHNYLSIPAVIDAGVSVTFGYSPAHKKDPDRTFRILKKAVAENPNKPREIFYLAREYRYKKDWITSLYWCNKFLKLASWGPEMADAQLMKARCLWHLQRGEEARDTCLQAIKINTNFKEALLFMAEMAGPINREKWLLLAEFADNSNVLFIREKAEKPASYYEKINDTEPRYEHIYSVIGKHVGDRTVFDIGCGRSNLHNYIKNYDGVDMIDNPYHVGDIYTFDFGDFDVYGLFEVLEHLTKDIEVLKRIPKGKKIIFSVPSFDDPSHVRMFTEDIVRWRYKDIVDINSIVRFNWDAGIRKWKTDIPATTSYILLCAGWRI